MKKYLYIFLLVGVCLGQVDYTAQIQPIFDNNCTSCHVNGGTYSGGLDLSSYAETLPNIYSLLQNHPNPFNPITSLRYDLPSDGLVNITIYDMMGRIVKTLVNGSQTAGFKSVQWNATNDRNEPVSAGLYLYTIQAGEFRQTKKMILLK